MTYLAAILALFFFAAGLRLSGILPAALKAIKTARSAMQSMNSVSASDLEKEQIARLAALNLMGAFFSILARAFAAIVVSLLPLLVMGAAGIVRVSAVASLLATWQGILLSSTIIVLAYLVRR